MSRIGQDAAMAQGSRPEFHAAAIPANHTAIRNQLCRLSARLQQILKRSDLNAIVKLFKGFFDLRKGVGRSVKRHGNANVTDAAALCCSEGGCSQGGAVVPCGRLHKDFVKRDRKSTRLNSSHPSISYAVFCL